MARSNLVDAIIMAESGGRANARNPRSSAGGAGQFINSTWLSTVKKYRPDIAEGKSDAQLLQLKFDPALSREMAAAYDQENAQYLASRGIEPTSAARSLAYFAGPQGAVSVISNPSGSATDTLGARAAAANPHIRGMSNADLLQWADKRVGGAQASPAQMQAQVLASRYGGSQDSATGAVPMDQAMSGGDGEDALQGGSGLDQLKKQLFDSEKLSRAQQMEKDADAMNNGSALGAFGSAIFKNVGRYMGDQEKSGMRADEARMIESLSQGQNIPPVIYAMLGSENPQYRAMGMQELIKMQGPKAAPNIQTIEGRDQYGQPTKQQVVWNPQAGRWEPLSIGGGGQQAAMQPQGGQYAEQPRPAQPDAPIAPGGVNRAAGEPTVNQWIGEIGASSPMVQSNLAAKGDRGGMEPSPTAYGQPQEPVQPAGAPQQPRGAQMPAGSEPGPAAPKERIPEGYMQVTGEDGSPLWRRTQQGMQPVIQPRAEFEAQARLGEKRASDQAISKEASTRAKSVVEDAKKLTELPGFEKALEINRARLEYSTPGWMGKADPTTIKQQLERKYAPNDPAWRALAGIESVQNQLVLGLMQLAPQKGPQSDKDAARYESAVGDLMNATSAADFKLRLNRVMNLQTQLTPGTEKDQYVPEAPSMQELQSVYDRSGQFDQRKVMEVARKYGLNGFDVQQLASHATGAPTKSQIWIGQ